MGTSNPAIHVRDLLPRQSWLPCEKKVLLPLGLEDYQRELMAVIDLVLVAQPSIIPGAYLVGSYLPRQHRRECFLRHLVGYTRVEALLGCGSRLALQLAYSYPCSDLDVQQCCRCIFLQWHQRIWLLHSGS